TPTSTAVAFAALRYMRMAWDNPLPFACSFKVTSRAVLSAGAGLFGLYSPKSEFAAVVVVLKTNSAEKLVICEPNPSMPGELTYWFAPLTLLNVAAVSPPLKPASPNVGGLVAGK